MQIKAKRYSRQGKFWIYELKKYKNTLFWSLIYQETDFSNILITLPVDRAEYCIGKNFMGREYQEGDLG